MPARDIAEMRLAELLAGGGCPLCAARAAAEQRLIDALIGEAVNDVGVRRRLDRAGGFCARHTTLLPSRERARRGGTLGSAILLGSVLDGRLDRLRLLEDASGRGLSRRVGEMAKVPECPLCADVQAAERTARSVLLVRLGDAAWSAALVAAPFCLDDLMALWQAVAQSDRATLAVWRPVAIAQRVRIEGLRQTAQAYVDHTGHDRQAELTNDERVAADRLVELLAGSG